MNSKAYTEVNFIINEMNNELSNKIPKEIKDMIKEKMDKTYEFYITDEEWEEKELLEDTEKILSVLYTDYIANEEEKKVILNKEKIIMKKKYENTIQPKNLCDVFANKKSFNEEKEIVKVEYKKPWYKKIIEYIRLKIKI